MIGEKSGCLCDDEVVWCGLVALARRAAGRSPRREPWVREHNHSFSPGGATLFVASLRIAKWKAGQCVAPPGLETWVLIPPTAHAVGYDLPPSGLKTNTLQTISSTDKFR